MESKKSQNEALYPIICHVNSKQSLEGAYVKFSVNEKSYYVPMNKAVNVPEWVYRIWLDSEWNEEGSKFRGFDMDHIEG